MSDDLFSNSFSPESYVPMSDDQWYTDTTELISQYNHSTDESPMPDELFDQFVEIEGGAANAESPPNISTPKPTTASASSQEIEPQPQEPMALAVDDPEPVSQDGQTPATKQVVVQQESESQSHARNMSTMEHTFTSQQVGLQFPVESAVLQQASPQNLPSAPNNAVVTARSKAAVPQAVNHLASGFRFPSYDMGGPAPQDDATLALQNEILSRVIAAASDIGDSGVPVSLREASRTFNLMSTMSGPDEFDSHGWPTTYNDELSNSQTSSIASNNANSMASSSGTTHFMNNQMNNACFTFQMKPHNNNQMLGCNSADWLAMQLKYMKNDGISSRADSSVYDDSVVAGLTFDTTPPVRNQPTLSGYDYFKLSQSRNQQDTGMGYALDCITTLSSNQVAGRGFDNNVNSQRYTMRQDSLTNGSMKDQVTNKASNFMDNQSANMGYGGYTDASMNGQVGNMAFNNRAANTGLNPYMNASTKYQMNNIGFGMNDQATRMTYQPYMNSLMNNQPSGMNVSPYTVTTMNNPTPAVNFQQMIPTASSSPPLSSSSSMPQPQRTPLPTRTKTPAAANPKTPSPKKRPAPINTSGIPTPDSTPRKRTTTSRRQPHISREITNRPGQIPVPRAEPLQLAALQPRTPGAVSRIFGSGSPPAQQTGMQTDLMVARSPTRISMAANQTPAHLARTVAHRRTLSHSRERSMDELMRTRFWDLTSEERMRVLLPILQGRDPFEEEQQQRRNLAGANGVDNGNGVGNGNSSNGDASTPPQFQEGFGARRQREALEKAARRGAEGGSRRRRR